jgi:acetolactate synthase-1/2/3 large subunit
MNGAETLLQTLVDNGVEVCFTNPGTSEMHMVAAMGNSPGMRAILCLFEGVASGAADGYARMAGKPACTLLHLGPGLSNASANLHNARRAFSPVINLVGEHASYHKGFDAPLTSDVVGLAEPVSDWVRVVANADRLAADAADAVVSANTQPGQVATLIVPADAAWNEAQASVPRQSLPSAPAVSDRVIEETAALLSNGKPTLVLMSNLALTARALELADRLAQKTGATLLCDTFNTRLRRGAGACNIDRLAYFAEMALDQAAGTEQLITVGTKPPVAFFAYPGIASELTPEGAITHCLAGVHEDAEDALVRLVSALGAGDVEPRRAERQPPGLQSGDLNSLAVGCALAEYLPEDAIVVDEGATEGMACFPVTATAAGHDWLQLTGGSIGCGLPLALGAAVACPDRKVICLHGDGGAMYTIQALWTMARERLDVCVIILANRQYRILQIELARVGAETSSERALRTMDLSDPELDFVEIARGMGVAGTRAETAEEFNAALAECMNTPGPHLIEAVLPAT